MWTLCFRFLSDLFAILRWIFIHRFFLLSFFRPSNHFIDDTNRTIYSLLFIWFMYTVLFCCYCIVYVYFAQQKAAQIHTIHTLVNYSEMVMDIGHQTRPISAFVSLSISLSLLVTRWRILWNVHHFHFKWFSIKAKWTRNRKKGIE